MIKFFVEITALIVIEDNITGQHDWRVSQTKRTWCKVESLFAHVSIRKSIYEQYIIAFTWNYQLSFRKSDDCGASSAELQVVLQSRNNSGAGRAHTAHTAHIEEPAVFMGWRRDENTQTGTTGAGSASAPGWDRVCTPFKLGLGPQHEHRFCRIYLECQLWRR